MNCSTDVDVLIKSGEMFEDDGPATETRKASIEDVIRRNAICLINL